MAEKKNNREIRTDLTPDELAILRIIRRIFAACKKRPEQSEAVQPQHRDPSLSYR